MRWVDSPWEKRKWKISVTEVKCDDYVNPIDRKLRNLMEQKEPVYIDEEGVGRTVIYRIPIRNLIEAYKEETKREKTSELTVAQMIERLYELSSGDMNRDITLIVPEYFSNENYPGPH